MEFLSKILHIYTHNYVGNFKFFALYNYVRKLFGKLFCKNRIINHIVLRTLYRKEKIMISEKEILVEFDKWLKTDSAKRIQDMQTKVKIMKRHDPTNTSIRTMSLVNAIGRILLMDYVFVDTTKNGDYIKVEDSISKVKRFIRVLN